MCFIDQSPGIPASLQNGASKLGVYTNIVEEVDPSALNSIENTVEHFMEGIPMLMSALDEVAKVHPFVAVAILAFKAAYVLGTTHRENDKKIVALYAEMKDMMAILVQLKDMKDGDSEQSGTTIKDRLQGLVEQTVDDIKACANACDTYSRKKLIVKVLKGPLWNMNLVRFVGVFTERRSQFAFALTVHTGLGMDQANISLTEINAKSHCTSRVELMLAFFQSHISSEERELGHRVAQCGGADRVVENDNDLKALSAYEVVLKSNGQQWYGDGTSDVLSPSSVQPWDNSGETDIVLLKNDLREEPATAIEHNMTIFVSKFEMQKNQIIDEVSRTMHREGDRIISEVTAGPHDKIKDPTVYTIWKDMGWRGSVKTRHFVLALHDYYHEVMEERKDDPQYEEDRKRLRGDEWALEWIQVSRLQLVSEAFDDDASGFITIAEANKMTTSRPLDWSLLHWLAYWAIGWQLSGNFYREKISQLFSRIYELRSKRAIHPANRCQVDNLLSSIWRPTALLIYALQQYNTNRPLRTRFQSYVDAEQTRLRRNLEAVRFDIDGPDTLVLITGPGRIEKFVFPLLYLLVERFYQVIRISCQCVLRQEDIWYAARSIDVVMRAAARRRKHLQETFHQRKLPDTAEFKRFAAGLFNLDGGKEGTANWTPTLSDNEKSEPEPMNMAILKFPIVDDHPFACEAYEVSDEHESEEDRVADGPVKAILGYWCGFMYEAGMYPSYCMRSFFIHAAKRDSQEFSAVSIIDEGTDFCIKGQSRAGADGCADVVFTMKYSGRWFSKVFSGTVDNEGQTLAGRWAVVESGMEEQALTENSKWRGDHPMPWSYYFIFKRVAPDIICYRPSPETFRENRIRGLWQFARSAVLAQVRREMFSWSHFKRRQHFRKRFIELSIHYHYRKAFNANQRKEMAQCLQSFTHSDARFYCSIRNYQLRVMPIHFGVKCCNIDCQNVIVGARIICLDCKGPKLPMTVDLCAESPCATARVERNDLDAPHLPTHTILKTRIVVLASDFPAMSRRWMATADKAITAFDTVKETVGSANTRNAYGNGCPRTYLCRDCGATLTDPSTCWYCTVCPENTFICNSCEGKRDMAEKNTVERGRVENTDDGAGSHQSDHPLIKTYGRKEEPVSVEERLAAIERRFVTMEQRFDDMGQRQQEIDKALATLIAQTDSRMSKMETLLENVVTMLTNRWRSEDVGNGHLSL
ncbi:hypothetical protein BKA93DRAFT_737677 [Sparassis latifolia]